jgi:hypothetical protein
VRPLLWKILLLAFVIIYLVSPLDLIPDFFIGPGWVDDLLLIGLLIWFWSGRSLPLFSRFRDRDRGAGGRSEGGFRQSSRRSKGEERSGPESDDPYLTLGLKPGATVEEIREAYRVAAAKYHPDKVAHLGKEFQQLAHEKFVAIQRAYERLLKEG